jgi:hypothetical protein
VAILAEEARPGRVFRCKNPKFRSVLAGGGEAVVWPRPVIAKRLYWQAGAGGGVVAEGGVSSPKRGSLDNNLSPGQTASQTINLPRDSGSSPSSTSVR